MVSLARFSALLLCIAVVRAAIPVEKKRSPGKDLDLLSSLKSFEEVHVTEHHHHALQGVEPTIEHPDERYVSFSAYGKAFHMVLKKNVFMHPDYAEYHVENGQKVKVAGFEDVTQCFYGGEVISSEKRSFVAVATCDGLSGAVHAHGEVFHIEPHPHHATMHGHRRPKTASTPKLQDVTHIVYRASDVKHPVTGTCGVDRTPGEEHSPASHVHTHTHGHHDHHDHHDHEHISSHRARLRLHKVTQPMTAFPASVKMSMPTNDAVRKHHERIMAAPETFTDSAAVNDDSYKAFWGFQTEFNTAKAYNFITLTYTGSQHMEVDYNINLYSQTTQQPFTYTLETNGETDVELLLADFRTWAGTNILSDANVDQVNLMSGDDFTGGTIGLAYVYAICTGSRVAVNQWHGVSTFYWDSSTVSHEMGHNFGFCHDDKTKCNWAGCPIGVCPDGNYTMDTGLQTNNGCEGYIMAASSSSNNVAVAFSPCSNYYALGANQTTINNCLDTPNGTTWVNNNTNQNCGDGILQAGEQCDCGQANCATLVASDALYDPCCDGATCMLLVTANCSAKDACCEETCGYKANGTVCRAAGTGAAPVSSCDVAETCTGDSAACPADTYLGEGGQCDPPAPLVLIDNDKTSLKFTFGGDSGGSTFLYFLLNLTFGGNTTLYNVTAVNGAGSLTLDNLPEETTFQYSVTAVTTFGTSRAAATGSTKTEEEKSALDEFIDNIGEDNLIYIGVGVGVLIVLCILYRCCKSCCCDDDDDKVQPIPMAPVRGSRASRGARGEGQRHYR